METQKCSVCRLASSKANHLIPLPTCTHYICEKCSAQMLSNSFEIIACNVCSAFMKKQDLNKDNNDEPKMSKVPQISKGLQEQKLLLQDSESYRKEQNANELCPIHNIVMDIICILDKQRICPHCALFGNHKNHRFKRVQDFNKDTVQKINQFNQILISKAQLYQWLQKNPQNFIDQYLNENKLKIKQQVSKKIQSFIQLLQAKQHKIYHQVDQIYNQLNQFSKKQAYYKKKQALKAKINKWQQECERTVVKMTEATNIEQKISEYFSSPLQTVGQIQFFMQQLKGITIINNKNIETKVKEIQVCIDTQMPNIIDKCIKLSKFSSNYCVVGMQFMEEQINDINPFMDCTSSQIHLNSIDTIINNNSIEVDITNIADSCKILAPQLTKTVKKAVDSKTNIKSLKSIDKKDNKNIINSKKKLNTSPSKGVTGKNSRVSLFTTNKSPSKILNGGSLKVILPGCEVKSNEVKQPQKIYFDFSKNTLTDFFDISDCNLPSDKVVQYVQRARRIHKIRGLKLACNHLNSNGFEKMIQSLKGVGNINLANNQISQNIFEILIKNKDRLDALKIINLSHNPISFDKKISSKIEDLKKMGIIVIL